MSSNEPLTTIQVTLSRVIDENGRMAVRIQLPDRYNAVEMLGLLEMAKLYVFNGLRSNFLSEE